MKCKAGDGTCECCKDAAVVGGGCGGIISVDTVGTYF